MDGAGGSGGLRTVTATRYVTPLREGGSLPGLMEADDLGTYVVKFIGAGQGRKVLVAEIVSGELARRLALPVPEIVLVEVDPVLGRAEPDQEVQELLRGSGGLNLAMDFLPGAIGFDPLAHPVDADLASQVLWFDALTGNVDRSWRNPNLLVWHRQLQLIDHGATLVFHHAWPRAAATAQADGGTARPYVVVDRPGGVVDRPYDTADHVLAAMATRRPEADAALAPLVTEELLREVVALVPDRWLAGEPGFRGPDDVRAAYVEHLLGRVAARDRWRP